LLDAEYDRVAHALCRDPHARTRAIRIAYLEAQLRAGAPIGRLTAEIVVRPDPRGLRIDVEVEARVLERKTNRLPGTSRRRALGRAR
jgi:hypothetical protein